MINDDKYQARYYLENGQSGDRPALLYFQRLATRYIGAGSVLDFGCGAGFLLKRLSRKFDAVGVEGSDWARDAAMATTGRPVYSSLAEIDDGSLQGVVSIHVVEHIPDEPLRHVLSEWRRVLAPGGIAIVVTPDAGGYAARVKSSNWIALTDPTHINLKSHDSWLSEFDRAGFDLVTAGTDGLWDFPYRHRSLGRFEVLLGGWPTLIQFLSGRVLLQPGSGESSVLVLRRRQDKDQGE
jgi:SAM-dependent methyltransferase